jgi:hypothetical protein
MIHELNKFYLKEEEPHRSCLLALRTIILNQDPLITVTQKYGMPCFCYKNKVFCYLWIEKKTQDPYILMVDSKFLDHPKLETGSRLKMKILQVNPRIDLPMEDISSILKTGLNLYRDGVLKIKD